MLISEERRFCFVHVQKTGGSTVEVRLRDAVPDARRPRGLERHARLEDVLAVRPDVTDLTVFGFVRNPWSRLLSWYRMVERFERRAARGRPGAQRQLSTNPFLAEVARDCESFEDFVMTGPDRWERLRTPQLDYLRAGERRADHIGRQESLEEDLAEVLGRLGIEASSQESSNRDRQRPDYREAYTPAMRDRVAEVFAVDLDEFGYEF